MIGTREAQPIGQVMPRVFMPITVKISPPMDFQRFYDRADDPVVLRQITDEVMFRLRELSGQEYIHHYAKRHGAVEGLGAEPVRLSPSPADSTSSSPSPSGSSSPGASSAGSSELASATG
jgi:1-acyl-sn-glycerol-3-phosphate acyltransferase